MTVLGLERIFSEGHQYHDRIFYDRLAGQYYDQYTDLYLSLEELKGFGIPC